MTKKGTEYYGRIFHYSSLPPKESISLKTHRNSNNNFYYFIFISQLCFKVVLTAKRDEFKACQELLANRRKKKLDSVIILTKNILTKHKMDIDVNCV